MHGLEARGSAALKPAGPESCQKAPLSLFLSPPKMQQLGLIGLGLEPSWHQFP